ncbi:MAG: ATP-dependent metallopeptidase FtsH/Yme1/Tma family protein [Deltaproteobacteria bacterium]|nr:ATP-dependent metallopeptidase FtsH/Yme1/Tma family protein [Deltaproteobacteria bacterium]
MEKHHKFSFWYVLFGIWVVFFIHNMMSSAMAIRSIPYSEFLDLLKSKKIAEVAITENQIQGKTVDGGGPEGKTLVFRAVRVDPELSKLLSEYKVTFKGEIESRWLHDLLSWVLPVLLFVGVWAFMMKKMAGGQQGFMMLGKKARIYMQDELSVTFDDVAGVDESKAELVEVVEFLRDPGRFTRLGGKMPRGVLLVGPPGTGKTLLAKAVAGESKVPFFSLSGSEFVELFVGMGAARVRDLFNQAKEKAPCIIFIDELDALGKARGIGSFGGHDEREQTLNQLLSEMDGFDPTVGVILLAATNRPEILDPALMRPGRFDRQILVDRPDKQGREAILKVHLKGVTTEEGLDVEKISSMTPGMVGADLANLVNEAALLAVRRGRDSVSMAEFEEAVERVVTGLEKRNRLINHEEKKIVAFHELGHAIVALSLPGADPVQKISIIPRGIAALGYTLQLPTEDRFIMKKTELLNRIAVLLGGRAAEEIVFGDISTGAHNDLARATDIARGMVKQYGMSEKIGTVYLENERRQQFLSVGMDAAPEYGAETAVLIDSEIKGILDAQYLVAREILEGRREVLDKAAVLLLEKEKMEGGELAALMEKTQSI